MEVTRRVMLGVMPNLLHPCYCLAMPTDETPESADKKVVHFRFRPDTHAALKAEADRLDRSMNWVAEDLIRRNLMTTEEN